MNQPKRQRASQEKILKIAPEMTSEKFALVEATERAIISSVFHRPELQPALANLLQPSDFFYLSHGLVWWAFEQVYPAINQITVLQALKAHEIGREDRIGYINGFLMDMPDVEHAERYAHMIREQAIVRRVFAATEDMRNTLMDNTMPLDAAIDKCNLLLFEATEQRTSPDTSVQSLVSQVWDEYENDTPVKGVPTGFRNLDEMLKQFYPGEVALLVGHPGMGKTSMLLSIVRRVVKSGLRVALFTMEQTRNEVIKILIGMEGNIARTALLENKLTDEDRVKFQNATSSIYTWDLDIIDEFPALTPTQLKRKLRWLSRENPYDLVVVDGLWLMQADEPTPKRHDDVNKITIDLVGIAKREFCLPILISHQYNQDAKAREDRRPVINDVADGSAAQRNLQLILAMHRDNYYNKDSTNDTTSLYVLKDRLRGNTGKVVNFAYKHSKFEEA